MSASVLRKSLWFTTTGGTKNPFVYFGRCNLQFVHPTQLVFHLCPLPHLYVALVLNCCLSLLLSIFVAVFLAFGINEWREANKDAALARTALDSLIDEMQRNRGMVAFMLPAHERVMAQTSEQTRLADIPVDSLNFLPIILRSTAWRTASETGALIHMDYETAAAVSEIYTFQEAYSKLTESMMASSFNINNYDEDKAAAQLGVLRWIAYVFVQNEQLLLEAYDNTLEKLVQE